MTHLDWNSVPCEQLNPLMRRQMIHGDGLTIARLWLAKGARVPEHRHANEQISMIQSGAMRFVVEGREVLVRAGEFLALPGGVPHSAEAMEDTTVTDVFTPVREDWRRGDDAYLRSDAPPARE